ncbi:aminotransferase class V-fold PLP-dependent enzyme [Streptosporangium sp. NPDC000396]|uniref:aminotransferase class V-fold PLP-dependent enzyme n=1 Tax=Streptosporangium sp. NPDC000396 TaxID=3366185 RepID=UPI00369E00CF
MNLNVQISWDSYLAQFGEPPGYVDFARVGPTSHEVAMMVIETARLSRGDSSVALTWFEGVTADARSSAARLLRAEEHEVAFVSSTSHGLFAAAAALPAGGAILVPRGEFPANVYPWLRLAERGGPQVRWIDSLRVTPEIIAEHLDDSVGALTVSAVDALTGYRAPLGALKEVLGPDRLLIVDAIQGLGAVPLEVEAADILVCGGQKWLRAGWGAALLLIRDRVAGRLLPGLGGWSGVENPFGTGGAQDGLPPGAESHSPRDTSGPSPLGTADHPRPPLPGAIAHTFTNPDFPAVAALGTAIDLVLGVGTTAIGDQITETLGVMLDTARSAGAQVLLDDLPATERGGIGSFRLPGRDPLEVQRALSDAGLVTTARNGWVRLSPHATTPNEAAQRLAFGLRTVGES